MNGPIRKQEIKSNIITKDKYENHMAYIINPSFGGFFKTKKNYTFVT